MATRRERVQLQLDTNFPAEAAKAAAAIRLLNEEINHLGGQGSNRSALKTVGKDMEDVGRKADRAAPSIDKYSGRVGLLAKSLAAVGPGSIPIAAVAIPAITGLASSMGFAAIAGGTMIGAFQGVGDALKALNKAHLEPTTANIDAAKLAMSQISPEARKFTHELQSLEPALKGLRDAAASGLFPGLTDGLDQMQGALPAIRRIVSAVSGELGDLAAAGGQSLAGPKWAAFFDFLAKEAPQALADMAHGVGNVAHAMASLWMAFAPVNRSFSSWLVDSTADLDKWATGLSKTQGFADFITYLQSVGPQVGATLGAVANALVQIVQAAAPIGGPVLKAIEGLANAIASIADSDLGTPLFGMVAALSALNLAMSAGRGIQSKFAGAQSNLTGGFEKQRTSLRALSTDWHAYNAVTQTAQGRAQATAGQMIAQREAGERLKGTLRETAVQAGKTGALVGGLAVATSGLGDKMGVTNTASLALLGTFIDPGLGTAVGAIAGAFLDIKASGDPLADSLNRLNQAAAAGDWEGMAAGLASVKKQIDDIQHSSGLKDTLSDWAKTAGGVLKGDVSFGIGGPKLSSSAQKKMNASEATGDVALRERGAGIANQQMAASSQLAAHGFQLTAAGAREASMSIQQFTNSIQGANAAIQHGNTWDSYRRSLLDAKDAVQKTGKTLTKNGDVIRGQGRDVQRLGLDSRNTLRGLASGALQTAQGMKDVAKRMTFLQGARKSFVNLAQGMGLSRAAARALADQLGLTGRIHVKPKITTNAEQQRAAVRALQNQINAMRGKTVTITVLRNTKGGTAPGGGVANQPGVNDAYGGIHFGGVRYYAYGDVANRHMPELAGPGATRIWREPETMGEAYIPLANDDRRPRARAIAAETVSLLGGTAHFATGGLNRRHPNHNNDHGHNGHDKGDNNNAHHVNKFAQALKEATNALEKHKTALDDLRSKRNDLASTVGGNFLSDPFAAPSNVWAAGGGGGPVGILKADLAKANSFKSTLAALRKQGLTGQALASVASSGDLTQAQMLLHSGQAKQFTSAFNQRAAAANAIGAYAGNAVYGAAITAQAHDVKTLVHEVKTLKTQLAHQHKAAQKNHKANADHTAKGVTKGVNGAASKAKRRNRG